MTQKKIDFSKANSIGLSQITSWLPKGEKRGDEWVTLNPRRDDRKLGSFKINLEKGTWKDFSSKAGDEAAGSDPVSLFAYIHGIEQGEAAKRILDSHTGSVPQNNPEKAKKKSDEWEPIIPIPDNAPKPDGDHFMHKKPANIWHYRNHEGKTIFIVCRYNTPEGKEVLPQSYCKNKNTGELQWRFKRPNVPLPLYGLQRLFAEPKAPVLIVEGEKCADAAQAVLSGYVVLTWQGGTKNVKFADWSVLKNREVLIWPDNDEPGTTAATDIYNIIKKESHARIIRIPNGKPEKWDVADAIEQGFREADLLSIMKSNAALREYPFRALGFDHGMYYYISSRSFQVISCAGANIRKTFLLTLAAFDWWHDEFPGESSRVDWDRAADHVLRMAEKIGPYDPSKIRGRGAWWDAGRTVLHLGDRVICNGKASHLQEFDSNYIYETRPSIGTPNTIPVTADEGRKLLNIVSMLNWDNPLAPHFLVGWVMLAPICGALNWRPHLWLTGPSGSGKSWVFERIIKPILGDNAIFAFGESTDNGIRQKLQNDALPVVLDEAEADNPRKADRIQQLLTLMRQSSSDSDATIVRGTVHGKHLDYRIRSAFLFTSIGVSVQHHADETRITVVSLRAHSGSSEDQLKFAKIEEKSELLTDHFTSGLRARAVEMIPQIRASAKVFAKAAARVLGSQRIGDQIGALIAGSWHSGSDEIVTEAQAEAWFEKNSSSMEEQRNTKEQKDEEICLNSILTSTLRVQNEDSLSLDCTIGELIARACDMQVSFSMKQDTADAILRRYGLRIITLNEDLKKIPYLYVANNHEGIKKLLKETPWSSNYPRMLRRLPGSDRTDKVRYVAGYSARGTKIPIQHLFQDDKSDPELSF
jgi:putative DNA primase/helicase